jgi:ribosome maturation factor RimP
MVCRLPGFTGRHPNRLAVRCFFRSVRTLAPTDLDARLTAIIAPVVAAMGLDLVRVLLSGQPGSLTLQVMAEDRATGQLTIDQCARLSRALDAPLDEADPIAGEYHLEVSSPGIDRPLTRAQDWVNWASHEVRLTLEPKLDGRARVHGEIIGLDGDAALVKTKGSTLEGDTTLRLPLAQIAGAKLVLTDRLIAATRPLDPTGADEIIESGGDTAADNDNETPSED